MIHSSRVRALLCAVLLLAGCRSSVPLEPRPLPYHVAIVPIAQPIVGQATPGEHPGNETEIQLELEVQPVTRAVTRALQDYCFTRVTLLQQVEDAEGGPVDGFARQRALLEEARSSGADLVLEFGLRYEPEVYREANGTFWLNYPLFLFAGPSNWFISDNTYYADVELTSTVYDLRAIEAGDLALGDPAARVLSSSSRFAGTSLSFNRRSGGAGTYALAILVPSGYLSRETARVERNVEQEIVDALSTQVVQGLQSRRSDLVRADFVAPFFVEPDEVALERQGAGHVRVRGRVHLRRESLAERVDQVQLSAGGPPVSATLGPVERDAGVLGYDAVPFTADVPVALDAEYLRLECDAGSRDRYVRSYTFRLPVPGS